MTEDITTNLRNNPDITSLDLKRKNLDDDGLNQILKVLVDHPSITSLSLHFNNIGAKGAHSLQKYLEKNPPLAELNVGFNNLGGEGAISIALGLVKNTHLRVLNLAANNIGDAGGKAVAHALSANTGLREIYLHYNQIGEKSGKVFLNALNTNSSLQVLFLNENPLSKGMLSRIEACFTKDRMDQRLSRSQDEEHINKIRATSFSWNGPVVQEIYLLIEGIHEQYRKKEVGLQILDNRYIEKCQKLETLEAKYEQLKNGSSVNGELQKNENLKETVSHLLTILSQQNEAKKYGEGAGKIDPVLNELIEELKAKLFINTEKLKRSVSNAIREQAELRESYEKVYKETIANLAPLQMNGKSPANLKELLNLETLSNSLGTHTIQELRDPVSELKDFLDSRVAIFERIVATLEGQLSFCTQFQGFIAIREKTIAKYEARYQKHRDDFVAKESQLLSSFQELIKTSSASLLHLYEIRVTVFSQDLQTYKQQIETYEKGDLLDRAAQVTPKLKEAQDELAKSSNRSREISLLVSQLTSSSSSSASSSSSSSSSSTPESSDSVASFVLLPNSTHAHFDPSQSIPSIALVPDADSEPSSGIPSSSLFLDTSNNSQDGYLQRALEKEKQRNLARMDISNEQFQRHMLKVAYRAQVRDIPNEVLELLTCPITTDLMSDPVIASDGVTYERQAIEIWLQTNETSPKTGSPLPKKDLLPNWAVKALVDYLRITQ